MKRSDSRLYHIWRSMRMRCSGCPSMRGSSYTRWGIKVCPEWQSFAAFESWALANGYADTLVIDRRNGRKDYSPDNCRWVTRQQNAMNMQPTPRMQRPTSWAYPVVPFKGATLPDWRGPYRAAITKAGKVYNLGQYRTAVVAALVYDAAARLIHADFACPNFPECTTATRLGRLAHECATAALRDGWRAGRDFAREHMSAAALSAVTNPL